ncbi:hypothetical protein [Rhodanobacter lindaniclasticus]|uniref:hypothetical protein n=1 Tax=Rhodanobacter lindaniclasticus TaxID=75310 RepID=UPI00109FB2E7|nr:hypothetical protein [Rhodanobacter lindaniclasticus]
MEVKHFFKRALLAVCLTGSTMALAQAPQSRDSTPEDSTQASAPATSPPYSLTNSERTYILTPGSAFYREWKAWIEHQNEQSARRHAQRHDGTLSAIDGIGGIGRITITIKTPYSSDLAQTAATPPTPPDNGPPVALPPNGTPGERITVVNQTTTVFQEWTYEWQPSGGGMGNWTEIRYQGNSCSSGGESLCKLMPE